MKMIFRAAVVVVLFLSMNILSQPNVVEATRSHACVVVREDIMFYDGHEGTLSEGQYLFTWTWHPVFTAGSRMLIRGPVNFKLIDGYAAKASLWQCASETELREMVWSAVAEDSGRLTVPFAYLLDGKHYTSGNSCPAPDLNGRTQVGSDWTLEAGTSAMVYDRISREYSIVDAPVWQTMQMHNLRPLIVQQLPCDEDAIIEQYVATINGFSGMFVRPERLVRMRPGTPDRRVIILPIVSFQ